MFWYDPGGHLIGLLIETNGQYIPLGHFLERPCSQYIPNGQRPNPAGSLAPGSVVLTVRSFYYPQTTPSLHLCGLLKIPASEMEVCEPTGHQKPFGQAIRFNDEPT